MSANGYSAIGLVSPKFKENVGSVLRAAYCYDSALVIVQGSRVDIRSRTDTKNTYKYIPVLRTDDLHSNIPYDCIPVGVDLVPDAINLIEFEHPKRAFYVFGPEDGTLGHKTLSWCKYKVYIPTRTCMNLAATVNVVLYDRMLKCNG